MSIWEDRSYKKAFINPACGCAAKNYYSWPFYILAILAFSTMLFALVTAGTFSAVHNHLEFNEKDSGFFSHLLSIPMLVFLVLTVLSVVALVLYFYFLAPKNFMGRVYTQRLAFENPNEYHLKDFEQIHRKIKMDFQMPSNTPNVIYDSNILPRVLFNQANKNCRVEGKCVYRVAILADNVQIEMPTDGLKVGRSSSRVWMFPGCFNSERSYTMAWGDRGSVSLAVETA